MLIGQDRVTTAGRYRNAEGGIESCEPYGYVGTVGSGSAIDGHIADENMG